MTDDRLAVWCRRQRQSASGEGDYYMLYKDIALLYKQGNTIALPTPVSHYPLTSSILSTLPKRLPHTPPHTTFFGEFSLFLVPSSKHFDLTLRSLRELTSLIEDLNLSKVYLSASLLPRGITEQTLREALPLPHISLVSQPPTFTITDYFTVTEGQDENLHRSNLTSGWDIDPRNPR